MIFCKDKKYIFSKDVYLSSDERVEKLNTLRSFLLSN